MNKQVENLIRSIKEMDWDEDLRPVPGEIDLLLYAPCPVKLAVKDRIDRIVALSRERQADLRVHIPMGCTSVDPFDPIYRERDPAKLPAIIASIGFGDFWKKEFVDRFVRPGLFEAVLPAMINPMYEQAGMLDPGGCYTIYAVTPYIFLVNTKRLGALPVPRMWKDLLSPVYKGRIIMCGDGDDMADAVLLNIYREQGIAGVRCLAGNVKSLMHSSQMAKIAGSTEPDGAAVFIIPCFFAESTKHPDHVTVVWPEDGAAASPIYFLAKKSEKKRLSDLISFFTRGFSTIESASWFMPLGRTDLSGLPSNARLKWVGWDFIKNHDINNLRDELNRSFRAAQRESR